KDLDTIQETITLIDDRFPKLETFYSFNTLKKDLLSFTEAPIKEVLGDVDTDYTEPILGIADKHAERVLKGDNDIESIDIETKKQVRTIINSSDDLATGLETLTNSTIVLAAKRAKLIAETEVAQIVEESRFTLYKEEGYKSKKWLTVKDSRVRGTHRNNEKDGWVLIDDSFSSGDQSPATALKCRCTCIYSKELV
ncbi:MAG: phage minor head protein, partial [Waterburya sp.]